MHSNELPIFNSLQCLRSTLLKPFALRFCPSPFSASVRPFTIDGKQSLLYGNVNELLGFEIADLKTGKMIHRVEVPGFEKGFIKRHGCPSHGIGLTPNEKELWVADGANQRMHIFDMPKILC